MIRLNVFISVEDVNRARVLSLKNQVDDIPESVMLRA